MVGVPDERMGEVGMAFVVPAAGTRARCRTSSWRGRGSAMANYKAPRHVRVVDALPLNASGKVLKTELRAQVQA